MEIIVPEVSIFQIDQFLQSFHQVTIKVIFSPNIYRLGSRMLVRETQTTKPERSLAGEPSKRPVPHPMCCWHRFLKVYSTNHKSWSWSGTLRPPPLSSLGTCAFANWILRRIHSRSQNKAQVKGLRFVPSPRIWQSPCPQKRADKDSVIYLHCIGQREFQLLF